MQKLNCLKKWTGLDLEVRGTLFAAARPVFLDVAKNAEAKSLKEAETKSHDVNYWEEQGLDGDRAQTNINSRCDSAITTNAQQANADQLKLENERDTLKPPVALAANATPEQKAQFEAAKKQYETDVAKKNDEIKKLQADARALGESFYGMRDMAITQMRSAFKTKGDILTQAAERTTKAVNEELDSKRQERIEGKAEWASDHADDGWIASMFKDEVKNYKDSTIGTVKLKDSEVEDVVMGIAASTHDELAGDKDPAKAFVKGLSDKESNSAKFLSLKVKGVTIDHVRLQVLQNVPGVDLSTEDSREAALETPAAKMFDSIASDQTIAPQLRGMLIGELANGTGDAAKRVAQVKEMYNMLKAAGTGSVDQVGGWSGLTGKADVVGGAAVGAVGVAAVELGTTAAPTLVGTLANPYVAAAATLAALVGGAYVSGKIDQDALEKAGAIFEALKDVQKTKEFMGAAGDYVAFKTLTGTTDANVEKILAETKSPASMKLAVGKLTAAVQTAKEGYETTALADLETKSAPVKALYEKFTSRGSALIFPIDAEIAKLRSTKKLEEFVPELKRVASMLESAKTSPELMAATESLKTDSKNKLDQMTAYKAKYEKNKGRAAVAKLPAVTGDYSQNVITATDPNGVLQAIATIEALPTYAADTTAAANMQALDDAIKGKGVVGGGGGGSTGGGRVAGGSGAGSPGAAPSGPEVRLDTDPKPIDQIGASGMGEVIGGIVDRLAPKAKKVELINTGANQHGLDVGMISPGQYVTTNGVVIEVGADKKIAVKGVAPSSTIHNSALARVEVKHERASA